MNFSAIVNLSELKCYQHNDVYKHRYASECPTNSRADYSTTKTEKYDHQGVTTFVVSKKTTVSHTNDSPYREPHGQDGVHSSPHFT